ncbi:putative NADP(+)-dependent dehydrogenase [Hypoxylon cercidicola]|nr:putative NADP(+)-dependent dehydrogenase [Hypoxylon cercidicola]
MQPPFPSPTPTWHNDTYPAISPQRPELSTTGKTVVITGAGSGIGRETAVAFASAKAARVVLLGRTKAALEETAKLLPDTVPTSIFVVDVTQEKGLTEAASSIGAWDILVLNAGYVSTPAPVGSSDTHEWWQGFETNVKGTFLCIKAFLPTANKSHATILAVTSGIAAAPSAMLPGVSAYISSKLAQTKMIEYVSSENPNVFAATVHPGVYMTNITKKSGAKEGDLPLDHIQLAGHFLVWMSSPEARFLDGRSVWANWDVDELKASAQTIQSGILMTSGYALTMSMYFANRAVLTKKLLAWAAAFDAAMQAGRIRKALADSDLPPLGPVTLED